MSAVITLDDALTLGQGVERPFQCPSHDDSHASASVNVLKGVWYCYACKASGTVDGKKAPPAAQLLAMVYPERAARIYPESWLALFDEPEHWLERFPDWVCHTFSLGDDPYTGDATFPVRTIEGRLAGVGRRLADPDAKARYKYPAGWSASRSLGGYDQPNNSQILAVVEGTADMAACWQVGVRTFCCYGSGLHLPQLELIRRCNPKLVLLGFDNDDAGESARDRALADLDDIETSVVEWPAKDPADTDEAQRYAALLKAVKNVSPRLHAAAEDEWQGTPMGLVFAHQQHLKEWGR